MADFFLPMLSFGPLVGGFSLGLESHAPYHVWADARAWSGRNGDGREGPEAGFSCRLRVRRSNLSVTLYVTTVTECDTYIMSVTA